MTDARPDLDRATQSNLFNMNTDTVIVSRNGVSASLVDLQLIFLRKRFPAVCRRFAAEKL